MHHQMYSGPPPMGFPQMRPPILTPPYPMMAQGLFISFSLESGISSKNILKGWHHTWEWEWECHHIWEWACHFTWEWECHLTICQIHKWHLLIFPHKLPNQSLLQKKSQ